MAELNDMVEDAIAALKDGRVVVLPTDTVYGLCASAPEEPVRNLYRMKGRAGTQPTALVASDVDTLVELVPELHGRAAVIARTLLPGPYTLVLPNPARRFPWLAGTTPEAIGVRVPAWPEKGARVLAAVGAVAATSANLPGGPDPARVEDVPDQLRNSAAAIVDAGPLVGTPSTVIDFTGDGPRVVREGAAPADDAIARVAAALAEGQAVSSGCGSARQVT
jgi:L-threonylcarbamoyladenylate synthase